MKEVVRKKVVKLLDACLIYHISNSSNKGGATVILNEKDEFIPTHIVTGSRVCVDYRRLNTATRKNHFPLSFVIIC